MHSIRTKIALLNVVSIIIAIFVAALISSIYVANFGHQSVEQSLTLLCETGKNNINYYLKSVEQSVNTVSRLIDDDLDEIDETEFDAGLAKHMDEAKTFFHEASENTNGVYTYYYRVDPVITEKTGEKVFGIPILMAKDSWSTKSPTSATTRTNAFGSIRRKARGGPSGFRLT